MAPCNDYFADCSAKESEELRSDLEESKSDVEQGFRERWGSRSFQLMAVCGYVWPCVCVCVATGPLPGSTCFPLSCCRVR